MSYLWADGKGKSHSKTGESSIPPSYAYCTFVDTTPLYSYIIVNTETINSVPDPAGFCARTAASDIGWVNALKSAADEPFVHIPVGAVGAVVEPYGAGQAPLWSNQNNPLYNGWPPAPEIFFSFW